MANRSRDKRPPSAKEKSWKKNRKKSISENQSEMMRSERQLRPVWEQRQRDRIRNPKKRFHLTFAFLFVLLFVRIEKRKWYEINFIYFFYSFAARFGISCNLHLIWISFFSVFCLVFGVAHCQQFRWMISVGERETKSLPFRFVNGSSSKWRISSCHSPQ